MENKPPQKYGNRSLKKRNPIGSQKLKNITLAYINAIHDAVIDGKYEYALSKLKVIDDRIIPEEYECYVVKLKYDVKRSLCNWDDKLEEETAEIVRILKFYIFFKKGPKLQYF